MDAADLIVVSDIFGRTPELEELASELWDRYEKIHIIDPYGGQTIDFGSEQDAYQYFQENCSIEKLSEMALEKIAESNTRCDLVGFSVGATAIWFISEARHAEKKINTAICFYGSKIRDLPDIAPRFRVQLIFPAQEHHFDVARLASVISKKTNVECIQTKYMHGFMNKRSENFDDAGYREFIGRMK